MTGLLALFSQTAPLSEVSRQDCLAMNAAQMQMEMIRATEFGDLIAKYQDYGFDVVGLQPTKDDADGRPGLVTIDEDDPDLLSITVRVEWDGPGRRELDYEVATLRYSGGG